MDSGFAVFNSGPVYSLIKERFKNDDLVPRFNKAHESTQYTLIRSSCDSDLSIGVDLFSKEWRVCIRNGFFQSWASLSTHQCGQIKQTLPSRAYFCGGVLIAVDSIQRFFCGI